MKPILVLTVAAILLATCASAFQQSPSSRSTKPSRHSSVVLQAAKAKSTKAKKSKTKAAAKAQAPETFKKSEFVSSIADKTGLSKTDSEAALAAVLDTITEEVSAGKRISLLGFGSFKLSHRKARKGRNPKTGEEIQIKASYSPSFTASKNFKEKVNEGR